MLLIGLTGSIGMGKSTTAGFFRALGVPVHDADAAVHHLYSGIAAPLIEQAFPGTTEAGVVDRKRLGEAVLGNAESVRRLEAIVHPLVRQAERGFVESAGKAGHRHVLLDIPLLFESGADRRVHVIVVVSCDPAIQRARVLARPGMTEARLDAILARQLPDAEKRRRAHFIVDSGRGLEAARRQVCDIMLALATVPASRLKGDARAGDAGQRDRRE